MQSRLDDFLKWLEGKHKEVLPLNLATGRWVGNYLKLGVVPERNNWAREADVDEMMRLVKEFKSGRY